MSALRLLALLAIGVPVGLAATCGTANYVGLCIPERRFLSDDEYIRVAAHDWVRFIDKEPQDLDNDGKPETYLFKEVLTARVDEFLANNPDCCEVLPGFGGDNIRPPSMLHRLMGKAAIAVKVQSMGRGYGDTEERMLTGYPIVSNCGEIFEID